jgi:hypothetical protein
MPTWDPSNPGHPGYRPPGSGPSRTSDPFAPRDTRPDLPSSKNPHDSAEAYAMLRQTWEAEQANVRSTRTGIVVQITTAVVLIGGIIYQAGALTSKISQLEERVAKMETTFAAQDERTRVFYQDEWPRVAALTSTMDDVKRSIDRVERKLDSIDRRGGR